MALTLSPALAMADTPDTSAPKAPAATSQSQSQQPAIQQAKEPSTQGDSSYACTEGTSTFKECFPDAVFRTYLARKYPLDGSTSNSSNPGNKFDDTVVTAGWAGSVQAIDGSGFGTFGIPLQSGVHNIQGIQLFTELERFTASGANVNGFGPVSDYSPMAHLEKLISVDFQWVGTTANGDLNHANLTTWNSDGMPALRSITFANSGLRDPSQLPKLSKLIYLSLDRSDFAASGTDQSSNDNRQAFAGFDAAYPNLQELNVAHCESLHADTDFDVLSNLRHLTTLDASGIGIGIDGEIPPAVAYLNQLHTLLLHDNQISDVSLLGGLTSLQTLDLSWNAIQDISPLSNLTQLTNLDVSNQILASNRYTANPDVTIPATELTNTTDSQPVTFQRNAYYRYTNSSGYPEKADIDSASIQISSGSVVIKDPHAATTPGDLPEDMVNQLIGGKLRNGRIFLQFAAPITNPATHTSIGDFDGLLAPTIGVPQVVIDLRGGTLNNDGNPGIRQVLSGDKMADPGTPERIDANGKKDTFEGWKACVTGTTNPNAASCSFISAKDFKPAEDAIIDDTTIYAHWKSDDAHTATFNPNNGKTSWMETVNPGDNLKEPANKPSFDSHKFLGWFTQPWGGDQYSFGHELNDDINLYAHWEVAKPAPVTFTVFFDPHPGHFDKQHGFDALKQRVVQGGQATKPTTDPSRDGYTFAGWYDSAEGGNEFDFNKAITVDTIVYAHWTFNGANNTPSPSPSSQIINRYVTIQNFNTTNNFAAPNGGNANMLRNATGGNNTPQQQAPQTPQAPQTQGRKKICKTNNVRSINPSIPQDETGTVGSVRQIADFDPQCVSAEPATVHAQTRGHLNWMWLLLLLLLLLIPFLMNHDRLPDIGQHKSPEIYHYN
ncbi:InlB B-repeat-containing protein [Bifidobacterium sp. ESL0732]|uniref:InlB B-repeat-containing protein n=1 Tax=Bifidobacterium sp. ESL0732 TaxID=2983222 RepID=UPI0023F9C8C9|nr:InlB B-repeat-containing protein [Bifidobacterium sp. ESL0732]WEV63983.1 InlB B-repeat-containing protein [Bifidobacterium sp. ESL0732]